MNKAIRYYLAGPMSGIPQFNFPLFEAVAARLRRAGFSVVSPAELDDLDDYARAVTSPDGKVHPASRSWGYFLSRGIKIVADEVKGIILLPGWETSRGASLEALTGVLCGHEFALYHELSLDAIAPQMHGKYFDLDNPKSPMLHLLEPVSRKRIHIILLSQEPA